MKVFPNPTVVVLMCSAACCIACGSTPRTAEEDKITSKVAIQRFNETHVYSELKVALESGEEGQVVAYFDGLINLDGKMVVGEEKQEFLASMHRLSRQTKSVTFSKIECKQQTDKVSCSLIETRLSSKRRTPTAPFSTTTTKLIHDWQWKSTGWQLRGIQQLSSVIAD